MFHSLEDSLNSVISLPVMIPHHAVRDDNRAIDAIASWN
jgi:hypothetical protein